MVAPGVPSLNCVIASFPVRVRAALMTLRFGMRHGAANAPAPTTHGYGRAFTSTTTAPVAPAVPLAVVTLTLETIVDDVADDTMV